MDYNNVKFTVVTPLLMHGTNPKNEAELRASSIKGLMRYWWRAVNMLPIQKLREKETELFGGITSSGHKSPFTLRVSHIISKDRFRPLMHKSKSDRGGSFEVAGISPNCEFDINISGKSKKAANFGLHVLYLASLLGGFGQRARRGFGAIQYREFMSEDEYLNELYNELKFFTNAYELQVENRKENGKIVRKDANEKFKYPVLLEFAIGKRKFDTWNDAIKHIGEVTHKYADQSIGSAEKKKWGIPRFASPYWVGVRKIGGCYKIVLSKVAPVYPGGISKNERKISGFLNEVLS